MHRRIFTKGNRVSWSVKIKRRFCDRQKFQLVLLRFAIVHIEILKY